MVEWLPNPDPQGVQLSSGGAGRLSVGVAQHQETGLLLLSTVPHDKWSCDNQLTQVNKVLEKKTDFKLYFPRIKPLL